MNKAILLLTGLAMVLLASGCKMPRNVKQAGKQITYIKENFPHLFKTDTVRITDTVVVQSVRTDTVVNWLDYKHYDTVFIDTGRLHVRVVKLPGDSIMVQGECDSDTVVVNHDVPCDTTVNVPDSGSFWDQIPWWVIALLFIVGAGYVVKVLRHRDS